MAEQTSKAVSFSGDVPEKKSSKQPPTQKYDRKEIQKRLDIENWMDDELKRLYRDEAGDKYPQLDVDDVLKIDEDLRRQKLVDFLKGAEESTEDFITELLEKLKTSNIKPSST
jgi:hypothetical protein